MRSLACPPGGHCWRQSAGHRAGASVVAISASQRGTGQCSHTALIGSLGAETPRHPPRGLGRAGRGLVGRVTSAGRPRSGTAQCCARMRMRSVVGAECNIQDLCCLHVDPGSLRVLEDRVSLGHRAMVHGAYVEAGALIGIGAIVLGRRQVGAGSLVAAGAVVPPDADGAGRGARSGCAMPDRPRAHRCRPAVVRANRRPLRAARRQASGRGLATAAGENRSESASTGHIRLSATHCASRMVTEMTPMGHARGPARRLAWTYGLGAGKLRRLQANGGGAGRTTTLTCASTTG